MVAAGPHGPGPLMPFNGSSSGAPAVNLANNLTILRIVLVPAFVGCLLYYSPEKPWLHAAAIDLFLLACLTDGLDGFLARKMNEMTTLGSYIDPIADKMLLMSGFLSLSFMSHLPEAMKIPAWVTITVISRDVVIVIGSLLVFVSTGRLKAAPLFIGKLTTVCQMATLFVSLILLGQPWRNFFYGLTVAFTLVSGVRYIRMGGRLLQSVMK